MKRRLAALTAALMLAAACGDDEPESTRSTDGDRGTEGAADGEPIVIGFPASLSGQQSTFDVPMQQGMELAIEQINEAGGVDGRPLELLVSDSQSDIAAVTTAALEVLEQGADVMVPPADFNLGQPAALAATEEGVLAISAIGDPSFGYDTLGSLVYNLYQGTPTEGAVAAEWAAELGMERPFLLENSSLDYTKSLCSNFEAAWSADGGEIAGKDTYQITDESFQSQVSRAAGSNADGVVLCGIPVEGPAVIRQLRAAGVDVPIVAGAAFEGSFWFEGAGTVDDVHVVAARAIPQAADDPALEEVLTAYEAKFGEAPPTATFVAFGYSIVEAIAAAVEEAGSTDGEALAEVMDTWTDVDTLIGPTTFTETCHVPVGRPMVVVSINGNVEEVAGVITPSVVPDDRC